MGIQQLIFTALPGIPIIREKDDLSQLILEGLGQAEIELQDGDVIILAQKIVSKAEGRCVDINQVEPGEQAIQLAEETGKDPRLVELILGESRRVVRTRRDLIIVEHRLGFVCANAGIDHSNVTESGARNDERVLLLPLDPDATAARILHELETSSRVSLGILIIDSHGRAWRMGTVGTCIGAAGFPTLLDLRGRPDLAGRRLEVTQVGLADEIAAGASALMGQADERRPIIHLRGLPYPLQPGTLKELLRPEHLDLFR
ncbi:MAG: coenzyme F420-0:L-glutamate ligase [Anaerolineales bacterium]|nr:coenzyme F420-0:L-glutamate ligase [Anaerolineales bacterium]